VQDATVVAEDQSKFTIALVHAALEGTLPLVGAELDYLVEFGHGVDGSLHRIVALHGVCTLGVPLPQVQRGLKAAHPTQHLQHRARQDVLLAGGVQRDGDFLDFMDGRTQFDWLHSHFIQTEDAAVVPECHASLHAMRVESIPRPRLGFEVQQPVGLWVLRVEGRVL